MKDFRNIIWISGAIPLVIVPTAYSLYWAFFKESYLYCVIIPIYGIIALALLAAGICCFTLFHVLTFYHKRTQTYKNMTPCEICSRYIFAIYIMLCCVEVVGLCQRVIDTLLTQPPFIQ